MLALERERTMATLMPESQCMECLQGTTAIRPWNVRLNLIHIHAFSLPNLQSDPGYCTQLV